MARRRAKEPISIDRQDADLLIVLMEYLKLVSKEAREDQKAVRVEKELELQAIAAKLALDMARIDQMKEEAKERADRAREAAMTELLMGQVLAGSAITIAVQDFKGVGKKSDLIQLQIRHQEDEIEKAAKRVAESRAAAAASRDHKKAIADSIQKLLNTLGAMNPRI